VLAKVGMPGLATGDEGEQSQTTRVDAGSPKNWTRDLLDFSKLVPREAMTFATWNLLERCWSESLERMPGAVWRRVE